MSDTPFYDNINNKSNTFPEDVAEQSEPSKTPERKVVGATIGSGVGFAIALIIAWVLGMFGVDVPPEVENAFGIIIVAGLTFVGGYWTRN